MKRRIFIEFAIPFVSIAFLLRPGQNYNALPAYEEDYRLGGIMDGADIFYQKPSLANYHRQ